MLVTEYTVKQGLSKDSSDLSNLDEQVLVDRARLGDKLAFRALVEKYQDKALHVAKRIVRSQQDAEDVVQEAFVKAYLSLASFKGDSSFYSWLYRIVNNMAIDLRRKHSRTGGVKEELNENILPEQVGQVSDNPEHALINKQMLTVVDEGLAKLSPEHRQAIMLREVDGLSYDEMADILKVNKGTVMSRLHYARQNLVSILERTASGLRPVLKLVDPSGME